MIEEKEKKFNPSTSVSITIFWIIVILFITLLMVILISGLWESFRGYAWYLLLFTLFILLGLGITLIVLVVREKIRGGLRILLILNGVSAFFTPAGIFLHNLTYPIMGNYIFFIIGIVLGPLLFIISSIGSRISLIKIKSKKK